MIELTLNSGSFRYEESTIKVSGGLVITSEKAINNVNAQVFNSDVNIGSFDAYKINDGLQYNLHFSDPTTATILINAVSASISAIEEELSE